jgi:hypothetical protein
MANYRVGGQRVGWRSGSIPESILATSAFFGIKLQAGFVLSHP